MRVNYHTEYAFRILILLQLKPGEMVTTREIAESYEISVTHLNKVTQKLVKMGLLKSTRGRGGGVQLAEGAIHQKVGDVMRALEPDQEIAQCQGAGNLGPCSIAPACILRGMFTTAQQSFWDSLNQHTIEDLVKGQQKRFAKLLF